MNPTANWFPSCTFLLVRRGGVQSENTPLRFHHPTSVDTVPSLSGNDPASTSDISEPRTDQYHRYYSVCSCRLVFGVQVGGSSPRVRKNQHTVVKILDM